MDKFVTKSPVNSDEKSLRRKGNAYDKQYDAKKKKKKFPNELAYRISLACTGCRSWHHEVQNML